MRTCDYRCICYAVCSFEHGNVVSYKCFTVAECVKYVEPAVPKSVEADMIPDLQQLYFCPKCVRSRRPPLELLSTLTCSLQSLMVALPEATAAESLLHRATCWRNKVQQILQSDEVEAVQSAQSDISIMSRLACGPSGYILQRGINIIFTCLQNRFTAFLTFLHLGLYNLGDSIA